MGPSSISSRTPGRRHECPTTRRRFPFHRAWRPTPDRALISTHPLKTAGSVRFLFQNTERPDNCRRPRSRPGPPMPKPAPHCEENSAPNLPAKIRRFWCWTGIRDPVGRPDVSRAESGLAWYTPGPQAPRKLVVACIAVLRRSRVRIPARARSPQSAFRAGSHQHVLSPICGGGFGGARPHTPFPALLRLGSDVFPYPTVRRANNRFEQFQWDSSAHASDAQRVIGVDRRPQSWSDLPLTICFGWRCLAPIFRPNNKRVATRHAANAAIGIYDGPESRFTTLFVPFARA